MKKLSLATKFIKPSFLFTLLLVAAVCSMRSDAQEASDGIKITETIQDDGTKVEAICITKFPEENSDHCFLPLSLTTPAVTLSLNQKMIVTIHVDEESFIKYPRYNDEYGYKDDFIFYLKKFLQANQTPIVRPMPSSANTSWTSDKNLLNAPWYDNGKEWVAYDQYCKIWLPQHEGDTILTFHGKSWSKNDDMITDSAVTINLPLKVVDSNKEADSKKL